jgi:cytochrome c553
MWNQPRFTALQKNTFFADSAADRLPVENTVQYEGALRKWNAPVFAALSGQERVPGVLDEAFWTGKEGAGFKADNYFKVDMELLKRGQDRFNAICTPCHGEGGYGNGVVTHRGFPIAASYHIDRLREVEDGYIVDVIKNGFGRMYSYNARVSAEDRWAIVAYIRALQYSQNVPKGSLDAADQQELEKALQPQSEAVEHDVADHNAH